MALRSDQGIVLRLTEYSESSQIVTLLAARDGLLRLIAKGARRSTKTRFTAGLDLLERGELSYAPPRGDAELGTLTEWTQRDAYPALRAELGRLYVALYAAEATIHLTEPQDPHAGLFDALCGCLEALGAGQPRLLALVRYQMDLLRAAGSLPTLDRCAACGRPRGPGRSAYFSPGAGGLVCRSCAAEHADRVLLPAEMLDQPGAAAGRWFELWDGWITRLSNKPVAVANDVRRHAMQDQSQRGRGGDR